MSDDQRAITVMPNGPLRVSGGTPVYRRKIVKTENGEPMTWETRQPVETRENFILCRCGHSERKPLCDGAHKKAGFVAEDVNSGTYAEQASVIDPHTDDPPITVRFDETICVHAGFCGNDTTSVWKMAAPAAGDSDTATNTRIEMVGMIEHCPSGALTYQLAGDDHANEQLLPQVISVVDDGPLAVSGGIPVTLADGQTLEVRNRCTLCRCGASNNKPLCDGSHKEIGFRDS